MHCLRYTSDTTQERQQCMKATFGWYVSSASRVFERSQLLSTQFPTGPQTSTNAQQYTPVVFVRDRDWFERALLFLPRCPIRQGVRGARK